jgi:hypothetical protein
MVINYEFLQCRSPHLVKTNTFTLFCDDQTLVRVNMANTTIIDPKRHSRQGMYTISQMKRAARLINGFLDVRDAMNEGRHPEDQLSTGHVCLHQYRYLFGVARIPMLECNVLRGATSKPTSILCAI